MQFDGYVFCFPLGATRIMQNKKKNYCNYKIALFFLPLLPVGDLMEQQLRAGEPRSRRGDKQPTPSPELPCRGDRQPPLSPDLPCRGDMQPLATPSHDLPYSGDIGFAAQQCDGGGGFVWQQPPSPQCRKECGDPERLQTAAAAPRQQAAGGSGEQRRLDRAELLAC